jgi:hypothetical protein
MGIITEWVLVLFMNGWPVDVDTFSQKKNCFDKLETYNRALAQAKSEAKVWCEHRPVQRLPVILDKDK